MALMERLQAEISSLRTEIVCLQASNNSRFQGQLPSPVEGKKHRGDAGAWGVLLSTESFESLLKVLRSISIRTGISPQFQRK